MQIRRTFALSPLIVLAALGIAWPVGVRAADRIPTPASPSAATNPILTPSEARANAEQAITVEQMRRYLTFIASDALQGRETPSPGLDAAAQFLAFNLSRFGLKPMGDSGTFFQKIALRHVLPNPDRSRASLSFDAGAPAALRLSTDYLPALDYQRGGAGSVASSPLVYVSHGWVMPSRDIDAYHDIDVRGKVMVVCGRGLPRNVSFAELETDPQHKTWTGPAAYARLHGARGIIYLPETDSDFADQAASVRAGKGETAPVDPGIRESPPEPDPDAVPAILIAPDIARRLFAGEQIGSDDILDRSSSGVESAPFVLRSEKRIAFTTAYNRDIRWTQNVVAMLEGSDPDLRDQFVALGAHYDHLGIASTPGATGDTIYNGADDDGSGTTAVLTLAEAFSRPGAPRPRRSLLFVWHCGEEKGLWGSDYFTLHPTVPLNHIITQLNIDMIGRSKPQEDEDPRNYHLTGPNEIYVIGSRMMSTTLGNISDSVNANYLGLKFNFRYDDPTDPEMFFYRSDHFNYARHGIPIIFYFDGEHADYHQVSDEISKIDFEKMQKIVRTLYLTATTLADMPAAPAVDRKLPFKVE